MKSDNNRRIIADSTESEKRVNKAVELLLEDNTSRAEWVIYCKENYNIESRQSDKYWARAKEIIKEKYSKDRDAIFESHHARLFALYKKALKDDEKEVARKALADMAKLTGVNEPDKKDVTSEGERIQINIGIEDDEE
jgi:hypothetical protein